MGGGHPIVVQSMTNTDTADIAATLDQVKALAEAARQTAAGAGYQKAIRDNELADRIAARDLPFEWSAVELFVDDPAKGLGEVEDENLMVERLITFARAVSTQDEALTTVTLAEATPEMADMRTVVLLGSSLTRRIERNGKAPLVYTPRSVPE